MFAHMRILCIYGNYFWLKGLRCVFNEFLFCLNAKWNSPVHRRSTMPRFIRPTKEKHESNIEWFDGAWNHTFALFGSPTKAICERVIGFVKENQWKWNFSVKICCLITALTNASVTTYFSRTNAGDDRSPQRIGCTSVKTKTLKWFFSDRFFCETQIRHQLNFSFSFARMSGRTYTFSCRTD